ncbi:LPXTG cell wall anchor domain-containing protein [Lachnoclostridium phytofermentans]|uniref:LPXTG-motif cell wall anchor domain protein n=1 Tax=Lachnoclostridium phytofermentans (strain ATCC 700394 / DSM 18823 / ISDg) TaxID=357809 RepID=A9KIX7_LACP7|nr:LPXTG cell wall anchor domain-containing protein [Lachnoclostridium phytofermentans]ABX40976.1 LPXTG-motif cell wall anchor domain protein [Lachnoclostridium phytofermentans ISDg]
MRKLRKSIATILAALAVMSLFSVNAFAASDLMKDGKMVSGGFVNAGEEAEGCVKGPGNWTQLNMGDYEVNAKYLHIVMKATGATAAAQIVVSDTATFNLNDLGITLTEEYQDVVLPVDENGVAVISWVNFMGLDGGSSVYYVKDAFLSDDQASSLGTTVAETPTAAETTSNTALPKTGENMMPVAILLGIVACAGVVFVVTKKRERA